MWLAYSRTVLAQIITRPGAYGVDLSEPVIAAFESYLDEWELIANRDTEFHWVTDADPDKVKSLADTWLKLGDGMAAEAAKRGYALQPPESVRFNEALIVAVLEALASEGYA